MLKTKIKGIGKQTGSRVVYNEEIERDLDLPRGWIEKSTGIKSRYYVDYEKGENALTIGTAAARKAVEDSGLSLNDIECIIGASGSPLQAIPCAASLFQRELGLEDSGIPCFDVNTTCYSFPLAMYVASNLIHNGIYKNILIISADSPSPTLKITQKEVRCLFGDGAAAVVLTREEDNGSSWVDHFCFNTYSKGYHLTQVPGGGILRHPNDPRTTQYDNVFQMDGKKVFKLANQYAPKFFDSFFKNSKIKQEELKFVIPHQTSMHGIQIFKKYGFREPQIACHIETHGNCIAASIPMLLHDLIKGNRIQRGDKLLLCGTSAGLSIGGLTLQY